MISMKVNVLERIERHLPEMRDDQCWISTYAPHVGGYCGVRDDSGKQHRLHRLVWEAHNAEPIPDGMVVMHSCDNPACINPLHLSVGTPADNAHDRDAKGRTVPPCDNFIFVHPD